jgi:hypothetical protein
MERWRILRPLSPSEEMLLAEPLERTPLRNAGE